MTDGPGRVLAARCYRQVVARLLYGRPHAAALLGEGSQVLGFDDEVSTDHDFGAGMQVFVPNARMAAEVAVDLVDLPGSFEGYPLSGQVVATTAEEFFAARVGVDPAAGFGLADWLTASTQVLASLVDGAVFHDPHDLLTSRQEALRWYPDDVWRYVLAAGWLRIGQEQAFVARAGARGDDLGSRVLAARLVRDLMRLTFLVERRWAPYGKWLGTAFDRLGLAGLLHDHLGRALATADWREREASLVAAASVLLSATNDLGLAAAVDPTPGAFFTRDIRVVDTGAATAALITEITDPELRVLIMDLGARADGEARLPGAIDQAADSTDVLSNLDRRQASRSLLGLQTLSS